MNIFSLTTNILIRPGETWQKLAGKNLDARKLFFGYALILALIPAISITVGFSVIGLRIGSMGYYRMSLSSAVIAGVAAYIVNLAGIYAAAVVMRFIGNSFHAEAPFSSYMNLAILSAVPLWLAGVFNLVPTLRVLALVGIYGIYILFAGIPEMIKIPDDRNLPFNVAVIVAVIILVMVGDFIISQFIYGPLFSEFMAY